MTTDPNIDVDNTATDESTTDAPTIEDLQKEIDKWKGHSRTWEERAKENNTSAEELAAVRQELDEKITALTTAEESATTLKAAYDELEAKLNRLTVAIQYGLSPEDAELLHGDDDSMQKLAARIAQNSGPKTPAPNALQGRESINAAMTPKDSFVAAIEAN